MGFSKDKIKLSSIYRGKVLDNIDPSKQGRVKIQVFGIFDSIDSVDIPWAVPAMPLFSGSGDDYGYFVVPEIGSYVFCFFEAGSLYSPVYFAEAPTAIHGIPAEAKTNYPNRRVIKTKAGVVISVDDSTGDVTIDATGASGSVIIKGSSVDINP